MSELRPTKVQCSGSLRDRALDCGAIHGYLRRLCYGVLIVAILLVIVSTLLQPSIATAERKPPLNLPDHFTDKPAATRNLRVLAYNVKHGRGNDGKVDLERTARVIRRLNPDVVALQEIDNKATRSGKVDEAKRLGELTGLKHHAFGRFMDFQGGEYGMAIISRYPLSDVTDLRLPEGAEPRTSLIAVVQAPQPFRLANVHFYATEQERLAQARTLLEFLDKRHDLPCIIAGDFNSNPDSPVLELFSDWHIPDKGDDHFTFSSDNPRIEIDFILHRPDTAFVVREIDVIDEPIASDHRPLIVDLFVVPERQARWWKGNLHTHSLWSDGNDFPEMIADWYRQRGYNFLALSDHNVLSKGPRWMKLIAIESRHGRTALPKYLARFGKDWVETRGNRGDGTFEVRLKPLAEFRALVESAGEFLMIQSEEITDKVAHINATNVAEVIQPQGGESVRETIQNNLRAIDEQAKRLGRTIIPHLNHPNLGDKGISAEDLAALVQDEFFEVFNGVDQDGDLGSDRRHSLETLWDITSTLRISEFGAAPDVRAGHGRQSRVPRPHTFVARSWLDHASCKVPLARVDRQRHEARRFLRVVRRRLKQNRVRQSQQDASHRNRTGWRRRVHNAVHRHAGRLRQDDHTTQRHRRQRRRRDARLLR